MDRKMVHKWLTENKQTASEIIAELINLADLENDQNDRDLEIKKLIWKIENKIELGGDSRLKGNDMKTKLIYFYGACKRCEIVSAPWGRYVCTAEGYDIYDTEEFDERYLAVKS